MLYHVIPAANIFIPFQLFLVCMLTPIRTFTQADPSGPDHPLPYNFLSNVFQLPIAVSTQFPALWVVKDMISTYRKMDSLTLEMIHEKQIQMKILSALGLLQSWRCLLQFLEMHT